MTEMAGLRNRGLGVMTGMRNFNEDFEYFLNNGLTLATLEEKETYGPAIFEYFKSEKTQQFVTMDWDEKECKKRIKSFLEFNYGIFADFEIFKIKEIEESWKLSIVYKLSEKSKFSVGAVSTKMYDIFCEVHPLFAKDFSHFKEKYE